MKVVSDSTPLIALSRINELDVLHKIFSTIMMLPLTQFDAAILTANNGRIIATVCHKVENSGANQSLAR
jgi:predicted nucleic acid-binding protein